MLLNQLRGFGRAGDDLLLLKLRPDGRIFGERGENLVRDFALLLLGQAERITLDITCQTHAAGCCQTGKTAMDFKHAHFCSPSILRISSRRLAARS